MKFQLENLPETILLGAFALIDPKKLLDLRFLNKFFFEIISKPIRQHLDVSAYIDRNGRINTSVHMEYENFEVVQKDYMNKNSSNIKLLLIKSEDNVRYLGLCSNIDELIISYLFIPLIDFTQYNFTNLTKLELQIFRDTFRDNHFGCGEILISLSTVLYGLEEFKIYTIVAIDMDFILSLLNPNKLKILEFFVKLPAVEKNKFIRLQDFVCLERFSFTLTVHAPCTQEPEINLIPFPNLITFEVFGNLGDDFDFNVFGSLPPLNNLKVCWNIGNGKIFDFIKQTEYQNLILDCSFIHFSHRSMPLMPVALNPISTVKNISILEISHLYVGNNDNVNLNGTIPQYSNIQKIVFKECKLSIQYLFSILRYFPDIRNVKYEGKVLINFSNQPIFPPRNPDQFFFILNRSCITKGNDIPDLLSNINTYIF